MLTAAILLLLLSLERYNFQCSICSVRRRRWWWGSWWYCCWCWWLWVRFDGHICCVVVKHHRMKLTNEIECERSMCAAVSSNVPDRKLVSDWGFTSTSPNVLPWPAVYCRDDEMMCAGRSASSYSCVLCVCYIKVRALAFRPRVPNIILSLIVIYMYIV